MMELIVIGAAIGVIATIGMDIWTLILNRTAGVPMPNRAMLGRWSVNALQGRVFHDSIAAVPAIPRENDIGWLVHYVVGIIFGAAFVAVAGAGWLAAPTLAPALAFGIVTVGFGWFLLHPGMGAGWAAAKTPKPWQARFQSLAGHVVFGVSLWLGALLLG